MRSMGRSCRGEVVSFVLMRRNAENFRMIAFRTWREIHYFKGFCGKCHSEFCGFRVILIAYVICLYCDNMKRLRIFLIGEDAQKKCECTAIANLYIEYANERDAVRIFKKTIVLEVDVSGYASFDVSNIVPEAQDLVIHKMWLSVDGDSKEKHDILEKYLMLKDADLILIHVPQSVWRIDDRTARRYGSHY